MRAMRLLQAIGGAEDELLSAYENDTISPARPQARPWLRWGGLVAALCLVIAAALLAPWTPQEAPAPPAHGTPLAEDKRQTEIINSYESAEGAETAACYVTPEPGYVLYHIPVAEAMERSVNSDAVFFVAIDIFDDSQNPLAADSPELAAEIERLLSLGLRVGWSESWTYQGQGERVPSTFLSGLFTLDELEIFPAGDEYGYALRFAANGDGSPVEPDLEVFGGRQELELSQVYAVPELGDYLPASAPEGFVPESSVLEATSTGGTTRISALWLKGYDELSWQVYYYDESMASRLTSAAKKENYDLALYPIPRAQSVPGELREIVDNPIFHIEELTLDVVMARAYISGEAGDSHGYCLRFSVLYDDVVVEISAKGVDPAWVYEQLASRGD